MKNRCILLDHQVKPAMLRTVYILSLEPLHTSECRWVFLGQGTCWLICTLTRGKVEQWFVRHKCYQFCKRNAIQLISSLYIHRCSLLASLERLRRWQVSAQKIPIALDKCELAKNQECLAMSRCAWFVSKDCGRTLNCQLPFLYSEADNKIWGFRMDRATMQKYVDVSLQHSEDLDAFGSCICTIMAVSEKRWFFSKQLQRLKSKVSTILPTFWHEVQNFRHGTLLQVSQQIDCRYIFRRNFRMACGMSYSQ